MNDLPAAFNELGVQLPLLIAGWIAVGLLVLGILLCVADAVFDWDEFGYVSGLIFVLGAAIAALLWVLMMIPFDGKYQHNYEVQGHVDEVSNVLSDADGELTRQPVVTLDTIGRPLVVDDPRAIGLQDRDVTLRCVVEWHYQAADSYSCKIVDFGTAS